MKMEARTVQEIVRTFGVNDLKFTRIPATTPKQLILDGKWTKTGNGMIIGKLRNVA